MNKSRKRTTVIGVIGLITILVMALGAIVVLAQDDAPVEPALPLGRGGFHDGYHGDFHGRDRSANDEDLAEALGIPVEELQAARQKVAADRLAQAVEDGYLTKDQANTILAMQALKGHLDRGAIMAQALGLSVEEFAAAREDGTLTDQLDDITPADLQEKMKTAVEEIVQQAVEENIITAEQATLVLESLQNGLAMRGTFGLDRQFGGHHGFGGRGSFDGRGFHDFHGFHGAPQIDEEGETFAPFRTFRIPTPFGA